MKVIVLDLFVCETLTDLFSINRIKTSIKEDLMRTKNSSTKTEDARNCGGKTKSTKNCGNKSQKSKSSEDKDCK